MRDASSPSQTVRLPSVLTKELAQPMIVLIERRSLFRECFTLCLRAMSGHNVLAFATVEEWLASPGSSVSALVIVCGGNAADEEVERGMARLAQSAAPHSTILISDCDEPHSIVAALAKGIRGFIPTNVPLDVAIAALRLVHAGGTFVPAASLLAAHHKSAPQSKSPLGQTTRLTPRQQAVFEGLRKGKPNKIIAYELNMRESTVKVHVRAIMRKLKARNRTEAAFMANAIEAGDAAKAGAEPVVAARVRSVSDLAA
jgi:DNA-binding NarL/FixJ family response regulator